MDELHVKYRPQEWKDVLGQEPVTESIQNALRRKACRAFILIGPSGVGKTTIARLIAQELGVQQNSGGYSELDAATRTGVDDMRDLKATLHLVPLGGNRNRVICLDEAHMLSKSAWNSLLKDVEEPPEGVHWVFCTTEPDKLPKAIRTRCLEYVLTEVSDKQISGLLAKVIEEEKLTVSEAVEQMLIESAMGSPRSLLVGLAKVSDCETDEEAERVLQSISLEGNKDIADFCRALMKGSDWKTMCGILKKMESPSAEGIRNVVCAWFTKVAIDARSAQDAQRAMAILDAFGRPYPPAGSSLHPVLLSLGELLLTGE